MAVTLLLHRLCSTDYQVSFGIVPVGRLGALHVSEPFSNRQAGYCGLWQTFRPVHSVWNCLPTRTVVLGGGPLKDPRSHRCYLRFHHPKTDGFAADTCSPTPSLTTHLSSRADDVAGAQVVSCRCGLLFEAVSMAGKPIASFFFDFCMESHAKPFGRRAYFPFRGKQRRSRTSLR